MVERSIESLISKNYNVIYDATNLKAKYIQLISSVVKHTARVEYQIFDVPLDIAIQRDDVRVRKVGKDVIEKMYRNYLALLDSFDFAPINPIPNRYVAPKFDPNKKPCIIVDIDGTLAHTSGKRSPYDYSKVEVDDLDWVLNRLLLQIESGFLKYQIVILSGREDSCREATANWLDKHRINFDKLLMRKTGDGRKDSIIKEEIFWESIEPNYNVLCVFDDRDQVVKMWRNLGIKCLQVEYGNF